MLPHCFVSRCFDQMFLRLDLSLRMFFVFLLKERIVDDKLITVQHLAQALDCTPAGFLLHHNVLASAL